MAAQLTAQSVSESQVFRAAQLWLCFECSVHEKSCATVPSPTFHRRLLSAACPCLLRPKDPPWDHSTAACHVRVCMLSQCHLPLRCLLRHSVIPFLCAFPGNSGSCAPLRLHQYVRHRPRGPPGASARRSRVLVGTDRCQTRVHCEYPLPTRAAVRPAVVIARGRLSAPDP